MANSALVTPVEGEKVRCVVNEAATECVFCELHDQNRTYIEDPQSPKQKSMNYNEEIDVDKRA